MSGQCTSSWHGDIELPTTGASTLGHSRSLINAKEHSMETVTLTAPDISCEHCKATIEREIGGLHGVGAVAVDVPSQHVTVSYDPTQLDETDIVAKLDDEGYPVAGLS
jgi:copper chaperone CopZ